MNAENIQKLLTKLGCSKIRVVDEHVYSSCPLARYKHASGQDKHPSFAVMVDDEGRSGGRCHTGGCSFSGSLMELIHVYSRLSHQACDDLFLFVEAKNGPNYGTLHEKLTKKHGWTPPEPGLAPVPKAARPAPVPMPALPSEPGLDPDREVAGIVKVQMELLKKVGDGELKELPSDALKGFLPCPAKVLEYLTGSGLCAQGTRRRLTPEMVKKWELCWDAQFKRIVIPVRDVKRRLVGYSQRVFDPNTKAPKYMHLKGFRRDFYLYGEHFWPETPGGTCCVVEGFFDVQRLNEYGYFVGAMMGSHLSEFQIEKIVRFFDRVLIVPDGDKPGYEASTKMYQQLSVRLPTHIVPTPSGMDPDDFSVEQAHQLIGVPGEC